MNQTFQNGAIQFGCVHWEVDDFIRTSPPSLYQVVSCSILGIVEYAAEPILCHPILHLGEPKMPDQDQSMML